MNYLKDKGRNIKYKLASLNQANLCLDTDHKKLYVLGQKFEHDDIVYN